MHINTTNRWAKDFQDLLKAVKAEVDSTSISQKIVIKKVITESQQRKSLAIVNEWFQQLLGKPLKV